MSIACTFVPRAGFSAGIWDGPSVFARFVERLVWAHDNCENSAFYDIGLVTSVALTAACAFLVLQYVREKLNRIKIIMLYDAATLLALKEREYRDSQGYSGKASDAAIVWRKRPWVERLQQALANPSMVFRRRRRSMS